LLPWRLSAKLEQYFPVLSSRKPKGNHPHERCVGRRGRALLATLPFGQVKLMEFDLMKLGPLSPLHLLLTEGWATDRAVHLRMSAEK
jgi:hypothetical protein